MTDLDNPTPASPKPPLSRFLRDAWALARPYFGSSQEKWRARALLAAIVLLNLGSVFMLVQLNDWNRLFYDALQQKNQDVFWTQLGRFCWLAAAFIVIAVYKFYLTQLLEVRWRAWLTDQMLNRWTSENRHYHLELMRRTAAAGADNPDQRIQEDLNLFTGYSVSLCMGLLNASITLASFVGILWSLSGDFTLGGVTIPGFMVWAALVYCIVGSFLTQWIGKPLAGLNFNQQRLEADFRHHLIRVREHGEAIALDGGAPVERGRLSGRFGKVLGNYLSLLRAQKRLVWFTTGFGQVAVVFPFIVAAPRFFSGAIQLGELMQIASAFGRVQDSLSWFVDNYDKLAVWRATTGRLTGFEHAMSGLNLAQEDGTQPSSAIKFEGSDRELAARDLQLALPGGTPVLRDVRFDLPPGRAVLLQGPSGSGKSTLFRALAGIWPFARGEVTRPGELAVLPQKPYVPNGPLREALAYPHESSRYSTTQMQGALNEARLTHLTDRLDESRAWDQLLSGGELQRLALARVFLQRPRWVLADEATSALDVEAESALYAALIRLVREGGGSIISIGHRPGLGALHDEIWTIQDCAEGGGGAPSPAARCLATA